MSLFRYVKIPATAAVLSLTPLIALAQTQPKPATEATKAANRAVQQYLNFNDKQDFEDAKRGLIARPDTLTIKGAKGNVVWDLEEYKTYIGDDKPAPDTVNPSLWRNAQLNMHYGLFKVHDRIFQVRGYDLSNITFIQGNTGWIVFDPLISEETAKAAYDLVTKKLGSRPVVAVVYSHSHVDHYGGVRGIVDEADVKAGKVQILAPEHFTEHAVSENVIAGNAMGRRAIYMYGAAAAAQRRRAASTAVWARPSRPAPPTLIVPTRDIKKTGEEVDDRWREDGVPDDAGHRGAGGDEHLLPAIQRDVDGGERHQHDAQHPDAARRAGARSAQMGELPRRDHRPLRRQRRGEVPEPPLADVGQCQDHRLLEEAARPVQVHSRPVGAT